MNAPKDVLLADPSGVPLLFAVHSIWLQLEPVVVDDEDRLDHAASILESWIGPHLRLAEDGFSPARPYDGLRDFVAGIAFLFDPELPPHLTPAWRTAATRTGHQLRCRGGAKSVVSPFGFRLRVRTDGLRGTPSIFLHVTVPSAASTDELHAKMLELCATLRVRWGCAGLGFSVPSVRAGAAMKKLFSHAERHPGYDVTCDLDPCWERKVRTVSWLTAVGRGLGKELDVDDPTLTQLPGVKSEPIPGGVLFQAGDAPVAGDFNRLVVPEPYAVVDRALRGVRAREDATFPAPWRTDSSSAWLRRFERNVV